jgi:DNA polymerase-4
MDMDAFFAAVEQKRHPELIGKPVVIGGSGDPTQRGVVSTASYEARKFGIHSAMPLRTAFKLCPDAIFLAVDYREYARVSEKIKSLLGEFSPVMEDVGIDEAFLDITDIHEPSQEISKEIKKRIGEYTGLTCSIGIAPNKLLAKIASDLQKPDGLTIITEADVESLIWPLPVRKLWGVGPKMEAYLKGIGIMTIGELAATSIDDLHRHFGKSYGNYLFEASRGIDESPLVTHWEPKSTSREVTFQSDIINWQELARNVADLTREVVEDIRSRTCRCRTVTVKMRFNDFRTLTRAKTLPGYSDSLEEIRKAAFDCLNRFEIKKKVRLLGVRLSGFERED